MKIKPFLFLAFLMAAVGLNATESLPILRVTFPAQSLNYEEYIQGSMQLEMPDGSVTELPAKFKTRGATARQYSMKPSFNMKLEDADGEEIDSALLDLRKASSFILDAMAIDRICMRNRVCFDIWNSFSRLPYETDFDSRNGTVGKFVVVYMNDNYKGIYCLSDKINRKLLGLKKPKVSDKGKVTIRGVLYKQGTNDVADQNTPGFFLDSIVYIPAWHDAWELHEPEDYPGKAAWQPLIDFYSDNNSQSFSYVNGNFYSDNLVDYSLFVMALCITDNWGLKNKYFSIVNCDGDGDEKRFIVTPWDLDTSLGGAYDGSYFNGDYSMWSPQSAAGSAISPFNFCFTNYKEQMKNRWIELRETVFAVDSVAERLLNYCNLFEESGAWAQQVEYWDAQPNRPQYVSNLRAEIDLIINWYRSRHDIMDDYFDVQTDALFEVNDDASVESQSRYYNLQGHEIDPQRLRAGEVYINNGKKFIKR